MSQKNYSSCMFYCFPDGDICEVEFFDFGFGGLPTLSSSSAVVSLTKELASESKVRRRVGRYGGREGARIYPIKPTRLNHVQSRLAIFVDTTDDSGDTKWPHGGVECICLCESAHVVCDARYWYRGLVESSPLCCLVSGAVYESSAIWDKTRECLECGQYYGSCIYVGLGVTHTIPICLSTVDIRLFDVPTNSFDMTSFSTARTTPSLHLKPIAVPPFSTAFAAYSTYTSNTPIQVNLSVHLK